MNPCSFLRALPRLLCLCALLAAAPLWAADILWMHNGDRLSGKIEEMTDKMVRIKLPYGEPLTIARSAIMRWRLDKPYKPKPTAKGGIDFNPLGIAENAWHMTGNGDVNIKLKSNTSQSNDVNLKGAFELANMDWRYTLEGEYNYETTDGKTDSHDYQLKPIVDIFFDQSWFWRSSVDYEYDMIETDYLSLDLGSGPGYRFWNDKKRRLELITQGGVRYAYWRDGNEVVEELFGSPHASYPFASLGWDYRQPVWEERIELFSKGTYIKYLDQDSPLFTLNQSVNGSIGMRYYFNDNVRLSWSSELDWDDAWFNTPDGRITIDGKEWRQYISLGASF
ncbi:hypothetical protein M2366_000590 [Aeromonas sp. BIGb0405]|uniref:DUF481 domain-containing protein n=1 Tax=unclassified Aeromonas TaxID=257493 RepID=UPI002167FFAE|nr:MULTISPECIES: DUF481 domain-containing protein [unclassified Aeromonas]MCS3454551.1 hypothetical protein [Aeromonas sp. BIGb0405]MCS3459480.1 hypothetical protein [Aeromonas sp. BIGb0445]